MELLLLRRTSLTPRKIGMLLMTGFLIGAILVSLGWAAPRSKERAHKKKAAVHMVSKKKQGRTAVAHRKPIHQTVTFHDYLHPNGLYRLRRPAHWKVTANDNAMVMQSSGKNGRRGVFGIMRRPEDPPNEEAVTREFQALDKPADLTQTSARVAGMRAIKVMGTNKENPDNRMVEYYVQNFNGQQYYILMMAPRDQWQDYAGKFNAMLASLSFN